MRRSVVGGCDDVGADGADAAAVAADAAHDADDFGVGKVVEGG